MTLDQVKVVHDAATAHEIFAKRQQLGEEILDYAHTIKVRALAKLSGGWRFHTTAWCFSELATIDSLDDRRVVSHRGPLWTGVMRFSIA